MPMCSPVGILFFLLSFLVNTETASMPSSQPSGPSLREDAPSGVRAAWENREAVRSKVIEKLQAELRPLQDDMKLINDGRIDQKLYTDYIVERPVLRYVFKSPAAKAERRGKVQDQIDDLRRRLAVADAAVFPLPFVQSDDDLTFGFIGVIGADGDKRPAMVVQIIDGNSAVVSFGLIGGGRKLLIEGVNTSSFKKHQPIPKSLPIWITGTRELPEQHGKPQSILTAKQFFPESYVIRNRPTTRPSSR